ncbi:MAG: helix-turn-helix domain-containing protein [Mycobacteriales bacterium]
MTLATVGGATPSLPELVDGLASRTGAWVVIERVGAVVAHGAGTADCPASLITSLVSKKATALRAAVTWTRGGSRITGQLDGLPVTAVELGDGATAWFVGAGPDEGALPLLAAAAQGLERPVTDPVIAELLHPRGPRRRQAPPALLVALQYDGPPASLSRLAASVVAGTAARVHADSDLVLVALPLNGSADALHQQLDVPGLVAGTAVVEDGASDWVTAARLAAAAARAAAQLGVPVGYPSDPRVAAELVVAEAHEAVADLVRSLPDAPLRRLQDHDAKSSGELVASLTAWCRAAFDVPTAAASLNVHPNTLRYRLKRATEVSGLDVTRPRQLLALQLLLEV